MTRSALLACVFVFGSVCTSAVAQSGFPDVNGQHWAAKALDQLQSAGLLVGYPDGKFRGSRPLSRYELAAAIQSASQGLKERFFDLDAKLDQARKKLATPSNDEELAKLKAELRALGLTLAELKKFQPAIADLKRASDTFELELEQLGVDSHLLRESLSALEKRIGVLEEKKAITIRGDANFWLGAGNSQDNHYGLNRDGRITGTSEVGAIGSIGAPVAGPAGLDRDVTFAHELAFNLSGSIGKNGAWTGTIVTGNALGGGGLFGGVPTSGFVFGNQSDVFNPTFGNSGATGLYGYSESTSDSYIQELAAAFKLGGTSFLAGRIPVARSAYVLRRLDTTSYFENDRWDSGQFTVDGVRVRIPTFAGGLELYGGRVGNITTLNGALVNPLRSGPINGPFPDAQPATGSRLNFDRIVGVNLARRDGPLVANLDYLQLDADESVLLNPTRGANRLEVVGGEVGFGFGRSILSGGYRVSNLRDGGAVLVPRDNSAWNVDLNVGQFGDKPLVSYRVVEANYLAPGDWGRLGVWRNPTNLESLQGNLALGARSFRLELHGEWGRGRSNAYADSSLLDRDSRFVVLSAKLSKQFRSGQQVFVNVESTSLHKLPGIAGSSRYRWVGIGGRFLSGKNQFLTLQYELSDIRNDYQVTNVGQFKGGFLTGQWSLKF